MIKKLTEEERTIRILEIGDFVVKTGSSTRETAKIFSDSRYPISNATVHDYMQRYMKLNPQERENIKKRISDNTAKTLEDPEVLDRVVSVVSLIDSDMTIEQAAKELDIDYWTAYRDVTVRYPKLNENDYEERIKPILESHSKMNLNNNSGGHQK